MGTLPMEANMQKAAGLLIPLQSTLIHLGRSITETFHGCRWSLLCVNTEIRQLGAPLGWKTRVPDQSLLESCSHQLHSFISRPSGHCLIPETHLSQATEKNIKENKKAKKTKQKQNPPQQNHISEMSHIDSWRPYVKS